MAEKFSLDPTTHSTHKVGLLSPSKARLHHRKVLPARSSRVLSMADMDMKEKNGGRKVSMRRVHVLQDLKWINHGTEKKGSQWALSWVFCELFARECGCKKVCEKQHICNKLVSYWPTHFFHIFHVCSRLFDTTVAGENLQRFYTHINHMKFVRCMIFGGRIKLRESKFVENIIFRHAVSDEREKERTDVSKSCMNMRKQQVKLKGNFCALCEQLSLTPMNSRNCLFKN